MNHVSILKLRVFSLISIDFSRVKNEHVYLDALIATSALNSHSLDLYAKFPWNLLFFSYAPASKMTP